MFQLYPPSGKKLPAELTSYDLAKTYAVILMIADHAGYYFYPEMEYAWIRVLGRLCVPVWFFLIGYSRSRDLSPRLWAGALVLVLVNIVTGQFILPLNILATMIFIRLILDPVMDRALRDFEVLIGIAFVAFFLTLPIGFLWEYGTYGLLFAMFGWFMRNREQVRYRYKGTVEIFILAFCVVGFGIIQTWLFRFSQTQSIALIAGTAAVCMVLYFFRPRIFPGLTGVLPKPAVWLLQLTGRRTLEIYVIHLTAFKIAALLAGDPRLGWFDFTIFIE